MNSISKRKNFSPWNLTVDTYWVDFKASIFFVVIFLLTLFLFLNASSGKSFDVQDSVLNKKKITLITASIGVGYTASMVTLSELWYKKNPQSPFHFFNDNDEWLQMDKLGHTTTSFQESWFLVQSLQWTGLSTKKAIWFGSFAGLAFQTPIEILDGFSSAYGASWGDELANTTGSLGVLTQYLVWNEIRIKPKYSFHQSNYAGIRPAELGSSLAEEWLKDYNGQSYWLSFNMWSFFKASKIPKWINLSFGYGGENMIFAAHSENLFHGYHSYRQYYLSFDLDFSSMKIKNKWLRAITYPLNFVHIPFPTLEYNAHQGIIFHGIYF